MFNFNKVSISVITFLIVLIPVVAIPGMPEGAVLPLIVDGSITINGELAPVGTKITAKIDEQIAGEFILKLEGRYAFVVVGNESDQDKLVSFFVNDIKAEQTTTWNSGKVENINITIEQETDEKTEEPRTSTSSGSSSGGGESSIKKTFVETKEEPETKTESKREEQRLEKGLEEKEEKTEESGKKELVNEEEITLDAEEPKPFIGILIIVAMLVIGLIIYFIVIKK